MSNIMSCGELKDAVFTVNKMDMPEEKEGFPGVDKDKAFEGCVAKKNNKNTRDDIDKQQGKKRNIKIAGGAKVLKIKNDSEIRTMLKEYGVNNKKKDAKEQLLLKLKEDYDCVYLEDGVKGGNINRVFGEQRGMTILNPKVVYMDDSENISSYRTGMSNKSTSLSSTVKRIDNNAYMEAKKIINGEGKESLTSVMYPEYKKYDDYDRDKIISEAKRVNSMVGKDKYRIKYSDKGNGAIKNNEVNVTREDLITMHSKIASVSGERMSDEVVLKVTSLYKMSVLEQKHDRRVNSFAREAKKNIISKDGAFDTLSKEYVVKYFKEELHREKIIWDNAIKIASELGENTKQIEKMATMALAQKTVGYMDVRSNSGGMCEIGGEFFYYR